VATGEWLLVSGYEIKLNKSSDCTGTQKPQPLRDFEVFQKPATELTCSVGMVSAFGQEGKFSASAVALVSSY
jgi:hypothetical protein